MENNDYMDYLMHSGVKGMHWGVLRYQNPDGSLTALGKLRYGVKGSGSKVGRTLSKVTGNINSNNSVTKKGAKYINIGRNVSTKAANLMDKAVTGINRTTRNLNTFNDKVATAANNAGTAAKKAYSSTKSYLGKGKNVAKMLLSGNKEGAKAAIKNSATYKKISSVYSGAKSKVSNLSESISDAYSTSLSKMSSMITSGKSTLSAVRSAGQDYYRQIKDIVSQKYSRVKSTASSTINSGSTFIDEKLSIMLSNFSKAAESAAKNLDERIINRGKNNINASDKNIPYKPKST